MSANDSSSNPVILRLREGRWTILTSAIALFVMAASGVGTSGIVIALIGIAAVVLVTAIVPRRPIVARKRVLISQNKEQNAPADGIKRLISALDYPIFIVSKDGILLDRNPAAQKAFGTARLGAPFLFKFRNPEIAKIVDLALAEGRQYGCKLHEKSPTERFFDVSISPVSVMKEGDQKIDYFVVRFEEETEFRQAETMRSDFIANASHELRTPLASLIGFIETLQGPAQKDKKAQARFLEIMAEQSGRMSRLVDDLLSLSRIEMKAHRQPSETVELAGLLQHVVDAMGPLANEAGVKLVWTDPKEKDLPIIWGDRDELIQIFDNLVDNAIKYGSVGERVEISVELDDLDSIYPISVHVRDFGPGIAPEHLSRLTERFYRVDVEDSRQKNGTGLGLAIAKHILARHKGRLDVVSQLGEGASFIVRFTQSALEKNH